jgi:hypothetical protein
MGPNQSAFYEAAHAATLMRNRMDHLAQNFQNISKKKGIVPPIFGALSWFVVDDTRCVIKENEVLVGGGFSVAIMAGTQSTDETLFSVVNPVGRNFELPVGLFELTAFDWTLKIDETIVLLKKTVLATCQTVDRDLPEQIREKCNQSNISYDNIINGPSVNRATLIFDISMNE